MLIKQSQTIPRLLTGYLILILFCTILYVPSAAQRSLHYRDEMRYAEVAREMHTTGNWWALYYGGLPYTQKPPVYFWILNLSQMLFHSYSAIAMVLPSIISAVLLILLMFYFATGFMNIRYALLSAFILATAVLFFGLAVFVRMDMLMTLLIACALYSFFRGYHEPDKKRKTRYYISIYIFTALATLVKGPYGLLTPIIVILVFLMASRDFKEFKKLRLLPGFGLLIGSFLLWVAAVFWYGGKDYAYQLFVVQTFGRAKNSFAHAEPFYYYFKSFPVIFLPWTFFLLSYLAGMVRHRLYSEENTFLLSWFLAPLFLFSCFSGKIAIYLLPIVPPAALLTGDLFKRISEGHLKFRYCAVPAIITLMVFMGMIFGLGKIKLFSHSFYLLLSLFVTILVIASIISLWQKRPVLTAALAVALISGIFLSISWVAVPRLNQGFTREPIAYKIRSLKNHGITHITSFKYDEVNSLAVYTGFLMDNVDTEKDLAQYLKRYKQIALLITEDNWNTIKKDISGRVKTVMSSREYTKNAPFASKDIWEIIDLKE